jgi:hypothetical protein
VVKQDTSKSGHTYIVFFAFIGSERISTSSDLAGVFVLEAGFFVCSLDVDNTPVKPLSASNKNQREFHLTSGPDDHPSSISDMYKVSNTQSKLVCEMQRPCQVRSDGT